MNLQGFMDEMFYFKEMSNARNTIQKLRPLRVGVSEVSGDAGRDVTEDENTGNHDEDGEEDFLHAHRVHVAITSQ